MRWMNVNEFLFVYRGISRREETIPSFDREGGGDLL